MFGDVASKVKPTFNKMEDSKLKKIQGLA